MHRAKLHIATVLMALLMAVLISFSTVMCMVDAFVLSCNTLQLLAVCGIAAVISTCAMIPRRTWFMTLLALVCYLAALIWQQQPLEESIAGFLFHVTTEYALCFDGVTVLGQEGSAFLLMAAVAVPLTWITAWVVCRQGNAGFVALACAPVLVLCLVIVDVSPIFWLVLLTFGLMILFLTQSVRERSANEAARLAWWLVLPTTILITSLTVLWPPADYVRADWSQTMQVLAEQQFKLETITQQVFSEEPRWDSSLREVNLNTVGPKTLTGREVLQCRAPENQYYLRGVSLGVYENNRWQAIPQSDYLAQNFDRVPKLLGNGTMSLLQVRTNSTEDLLYTPYFTDSVPTEAEYVDDAYVKNTADLKEYAVQYLPDPLGAGDLPTGYAEFVYDYYTRVPEELKPAYARVLTEKGWDTMDSAVGIAALVRNSAEYDLNTPRVPTDADFVLYFLEESNRGYCVHFASATVMLLRMQGIPARYVTGYSVKGEADQWITVTEDDAHAWVEYYVDGMGWMPLDPTPAADPTEPEPEPEPDEDEPEEEQPPEEPPEPEEEKKEPPVPAAPVQPVRQEIPREYLWFLTLPAAIFLILLHRSLTLRRRRKRCTQGHPNKRALFLWRYLLSLSKACGRKPEEDLLHLAEKARFSQHTLTEDELSTLQTAAETRIAILRTYPAWKRLWYRYGSVLF